MFSQPTEEAMTTFCLISNRENLTNELTCYKTQIILLPMI